jgi:hypothetical protein
MAIHQAVENVFPLPVPHDYVFGTQNPEALRDGRHRFFLRVSEFANTTMPVDQPAQ